MGPATPLVSALTRAAWLQETAHLGKSLAIDLAAWSSHLLSNQEVFGSTPRRELITAKIMSFGDIIRALQSQRNWVQIPLNIVTLLSLIF